jgi:hypothetical protein
VFEMSLKEEIDKLIQSERDQLELRDQEKAEGAEQARLRFQPLKTLLLEIVQSIDPKYIKAHFWDSAALIEIGVSHWEMKWNIAPNYEIDLSGSNVTRLKDGFRIDETSYSDFAGFQDPETVELTKVSPTEQDVGTYLISEITKQIAQYQHHRNRKEKGTF